MNTKSSIVLRITFRKQLKALLYFLLFTCSLVIFCILLFRNIFIPTIISDGLIICIAIISIIIIYVDLLVLFFHIDYILRNNKEEYKIGDGKIIRLKRGNRTEFDFAEIDEMILYLTPYTFNISSALRRPTTYDNYHFVKITMKSGEILYLTSLLYPKGLEKILKKYMKGVSYWREKRLFPTTRY